MIHFFEDQGPLDPLVLYEKLKASQKGSYTIKMYLVLFAKFEREALGTFLTSNFLQQNRSLFRNAYVEKQLKVSDRRFDKLLRDSITMGPAMYNFVLLAGRCGLRKAEIMNAKWDDISKDENIDQDYLRVLGKGNKVRMVPLSREALKPTDGFFIVGPRVPYRHFFYHKHKIAPHDLRAYFVTKSVNIRGMDMKAIMEIVGHSSIQTTQRYWRADREKAAELLMRRFEEK